MGNPGQNLNVWTMPLRLQYGASYRAATEWSWFKCFAVEHRSIPASESNRTISLERSQLATICPMFYCNNGPPNTTHCHPAPTSEYCKLLCCARLRFGGYKVTCFDSQGTDTLSIYFCKRWYGKAVSQWSWHPYSYASSWCSPSRLRAFQSFHDLSVGQSLLRPVQRNLFLIHKTRMPLPHQKKKNRPCAPAKSDEKDQNTTRNAAITSWGKLCKKSMAQRGTCRVKKTQDSELLSNLSRTIQIYWRADPPRLRPTKSHFCHVIQGYSDAMSSQALVSHESNQFGFAGSVFRSTPQARPLKTVSRPRYLYQQVSTSAAQSSFPHALDQTGHGWPNCLPSLQLIRLPSRISQQDMRSEAQLHVGSIRSPNHRIFYRDKLQCLRPSDVAEINHFLSTLSDHPESILSRRSCIPTGKASGWAQTHRFWNRT